MKKNILPNISQKKKILIICEGDEEIRYLEKLKQLNVWHNKYDIILKNARGNGNIFLEYQNAYQIDSYDLVLIFCDTEKNPYKQFIELNNKINDFFGGRKVSENIVYYANPCTMQIVIKHFSNRILETNSKKSIPKIFEGLIDIERYKVIKEDSEKILNKITKENYCEMKERIDCMNIDFSNVGSTNFKILLDNLESANDKWIDKINDKL